MNVLTSFSKNAALPKQSALPVFLLKDSNENEDVALNLFPNIVALISFRLIVETHFPPAKPGTPPIILENCSQSEPVPDILHPSPVFIYGMSAGAGLSRFVVYSRVSAYPAVRIDLSLR